MEPDKFLNKILPNIISQREYYPIISRGANIYNGNYSLVLKAIKIAYDRGEKDGIMKAERNAFNKFAMQN